MPVYPRACGATPETYQECQTDKGLSPRMRGNPYHHGDAAQPTGSIPAHAGQPSSIEYLLRHHEVYPRACGATIPLHLK